MVVLLNAPLQLFDSNGDTISGGKVYVYDAGTSNAATTYSDSGLTSAQASPVVADSAGRVAEMYAAAGNYRVVTKDAGDVTLEDYDDIAVSISFASSTTHAGPMNFDSGTLYVDSSNNRVGVGTTGPEAVVHVKSADSGGAKIASADVWIESGSNTGLQVSSGPTGHSNIYLGDSSDDDYTRLKSDPTTGESILKTSGNLKFQAGGTSTRVTVDGATGDATFGADISAATASGAWLATQAEAEAGTATDQLMTPERAKQAIDALQLTTAAYTGTVSPCPAASTTGTFTHSLSREPAHLQLDLVCTSADNGFAVGDVVRIGACSSYGDSGGTGHSVRVTTSAVVVAIGSGGLACVPKTGGATAVIDETKWDLRLNAY